MGLFKKQPITTDKNQTAYPQQGEHNHSAAVSKNAAFHAHVSNPGEQGPCDICGNPVRHIGDALCEQHMKGTRR